MLTSSYSVRLRFLSSCIIVCMCLTYSCYSSARNLTARQKKANVFYEQAVVAIQQQDYDKGIDLLKKSADRGNIDAQNDLGLLYESGMMVPQDYNQAMRWYKRAASQNHTPAIYNVGLLYYKGLGVEQNYGRARKWFLRAAKQGDADAQYNVGVLYHKGLGIEPDLKEAYIWFALAAINGSKQGLDARNQVGLSLDVATIAEGDKIAKSYHQKFKKSK